MYSRLPRLILLSFALITLVQCGDQKTISSEIKFQIMPKSPVVILSDFTLDPGLSTEKTITGPWFLLNYSISNESDETVTIAGMLFKVTSIGTNGEIKTITTAIDPADYKTTETYYLEEIPAHTTVVPSYGLYVYGLEKDVISYSYSVEVELQGWVGGKSQPVDRLSKSSWFSTQ